MGIIVRRTGAEVQNLHTQLPAQFSKLERLRQIVFNRISLAHAEPEAIRQAMGEILGNARTEFSGL